MNNLFRKINGRLKLYKGRIRMYWLELLLKIGWFNDSDRIAKVDFDEEWEGRIAKVMGSDYNQFIPRVSDAGTIKDGFQKMHNGIEISTGNYYGLPISKMLYMNKGVHEPEEEKIFQTILSKLPANPVMIEMGCFWAFYSMWFLKETENGKVFMIEPEKKNLSIGKKNLQRNKLEGSIDNYYIGKNSSAQGEIPIISLDDYISKHNLSHINIAHADIQAFEMEMLEGSVNALSKKIIDYFFISTHTNVLHYKCVDFLSEHGYEVVFHLDMDQVSSFDGFIVAVSPNISLEAKDII